MHQKGLLKYALNSQGDLVNISTVTKGLACECVCPSCGEKLIAKNGGTKRIHHFAHASGVDCEGAYETMLHQLAKIKIQKAFLSRNVFKVKFEYRSYCPNAKTCGFVRYDNCCILSTKSFNLKDFYDSCEQEIQYDAINRRSDLKIFSSKNPTLSPIYIEFFVTHGSDISKLHHGGRIIEIKIESEQDIEIIVENGFVESPRDINKYVKEEVEDIRKTTFWGFKSEDNDATTISQEIEFSRYILYASGKSQCYQDVSSCKSLVKARRQSLLEICFHTPVAFGIYEMAKYQGYKRFGIKNCLYCKNYVDSYDGMGKLCCLYKHLGINRFEQHDTARAKDCSYFKLNEEEMAKELQHYASLSPEEYTEL